jgi:hypothetical protein
MARFKEKILEQKETRPEPAWKEAHDSFSKKLDALESGMIANLVNLAPEDIRG